MLSTVLFAALVLTPSSATSPLAGGDFQCVATGQFYTTPAEVIDYNGIRYGTCCGGCASQFEDGPVHTLTADAKNGWLVGVSLFDFVSGVRIHAKDAKAQDDYKGVRYLFSSKADLLAFKADPAKYATPPTKELLHCPVNNVDIASIADAGGFVDYQGTRYYTCCPDCIALLKADPTKYITKFASEVKPIAPENKAV